MNHELVIEQRTDSPTGAYYEAMFKEQDVTREQFERTFRWYSEHPERLKAVYEDVLTELSRRKEEVIHQDAPERGPFATASPALRNRMPSSLSTPCGPRPPGQ